MSWKCLSMDTSSTRRPMLPITLTGSTTADCYVRTHQWRHRVLRAIILPGLPPHQHSITQYKFYIDTLVFSLRLLVVYHKEPVACPVPKRSSLTTNLSQHVMKLPPHSPSTPLSAHGTPLLTTVTNGILFTSTSY